jgi:hypothetical protein
VLAYELIVGRCPFERTLRSETYESIMYRWGERGGVDRAWCQDSAVWFELHASAPTCVGNAPPPRGPPLPRDVKFPGHVSEAAQDFIQGALSKVEGGQAPEQMAAGGKRALCKHHPRR